MQFVAVDEPSRLWSQAHQLSNATCRLVFGSLFQQSSCEHKGDNHHRSVEIRMPFDAACTPNRFSPKSIKGTEEESNARRQSYE